MKDNLRILIQDLGIVPIDTSKTISLLPKDTVIISLEELEKVNKKIIRLENFKKSYEDIIKKDAKFVIVDGYIGAAHTIHSFYNNRGIICKLPEDFINYIIGILEPHLKLSKYIDDFCSLPWYKKIFYNHKLKRKEILSN